LGNSLSKGYNYYMGASSYFLNLICIPIALLFAAVLFKILKTFPQKNIFQIFDICLGKRLSQIITLVFTVISVFLASESLFNGAGFVKASMLPKSPFWFIVLLSAVFCAYVSCHKNSIVGRFAVTSVPVLLLLIFISLLLATKSYDFSNLKISGISLENASMGVFHGVCSPYGELFFLSVLFSRYDGSHKGFKACFLGIAAAGIILSLIYLRNLLLLSEYVLTRTPFSSNLAMSVTNAGEYLRRFEVILSSAYVVLDLFKASCFVLFALRGISHLFENKRPSRYFLPISAATYLLTVLMSIFQKEFSDFFALKSLFLSPLVLIFPIVLLLLSKRKKS